ncbi:MAG: glucose 1-dehydrogenase [Pseudomonadota bacterium]
MVEGKNVIVSGAASGIGAACARCLLEQGAAYVALADVNEEQGQKLAVQLQADGFNAGYHKLDVREESQWQSVMKEVVDKCGSVDVLVNNAGVCVLKPISDMSLEDFRRVNDVNMKGVFLGTRSAIMTMRECAGDQPASGSIVNISSIMGQTGLRGAIAYGAGKAAVANMSKALAVECGEKGEFIRINSVHPGTVKSEMTTTMYGEEYFNNKDNFAFIPVQDYGVPEDIGNAVVYLASDQSRMVTGSELTVDGGLTSGIGGEF